MSARAFLSRLLLALVLFVSACSKDEFATETVDELAKLTDDIVTTVTEAEDKKAGVAEAQAKLDAAKGELGPKMEKVMSLRGFQVSEDKQKQIGDRLLDITMRMGTLQIDLAIPSATDPELEAAVDKLIADHRELVGAP